MDHEELMDMAKRAQGFPSDYRLGKVLGVSENTIYNYRHGISRPDELRTFKLCKLAGVDPAPWLIDLHASRAKDDELKDWWATLGKRMSPAVLALMFCLAWWLDKGATGSTSEWALTALALPSLVLHPSVYYVNLLRCQTPRCRSRWRRLMPVLRGWPRKTPFSLLWRTLRYSRRVPWPPERI